MTASSIGCMAVEYLLCLFCPGVVQLLPLHPCLFHEGARTQAILNQYSTLFQTYETPSILEFALVLLFETLHTIGTGILFFLAFPGMDSVRALMATNAVCLFPGMLKLFMKEWEGKTMRMIGIGLTVLAILMQLTSLIVWPVINRFELLLILKPSRLLFQGRK